MKSLKLLLLPDMVEAQSQLQIDAQKELDELIAIIQPFAESYQMHKNDDRRVTSLKTVLAMNTSIEDWKSAHDAVFGVEEVKSTEEVV